MVSSARSVSSSVVCLSDDSSESMHSGSSTFSFLAISPKTVDIFNSSQPTLSGFETTGKGEGRAAIFVGDSRTVWMHDTMGETGDVWSEKISMGLNLMKSTGVPNIESQITEGASVVMMGVNDCHYNAKAYISYLNELFEKSASKGS